MAIRYVTFNSYSLQDSNYKTKDILFRNNPEKTIDIEQNCRKDGYRIKNVYYTGKDIVVRGQLMCSSVSALQSKIAELKEKLSGQDQNLDITESGSVYRYVATVSAIQIPEEHYHISNVPYEIMFKCKPFGTTTSQMSDLYTITTTSSISRTFNPSGSYGPSPVIRYTCSGSPSSAITAVTFSNSTTTDKISVSSLAMDNNGDYLEVDCDLMTVKTSHDGAASTSSDFTGVIPRFVSSTNSYVIKVTGGGASFKLRQSISYYPTYL